MKLPKVFRPSQRLTVLACLSISGVAFAQAPTPAASATPTPATSATAAPAASPLPALLADLTVPLDISRAKVGTRVQATVDNPWSGNGCNLRKGALLEGRVTQVEQRTKTSKRSAFSLVFDKAECDRHKGTPFKATIFALLGPPGSHAPNGESGMGQTPGLTDIPVNAGSTGATAAPGVPAAPNSGFRSVLGASAVNEYSIGGRSVPAQWHAGMVVAVPMNLTVGAGAEGGSVIWAMKQDARLEGETTLILMATQ